MGATDRTEGDAVAADAVRKREDEYRLLVETSPDCIHQIDCSGRFVSMNRAGLEMLGLTDESQVVGMPFLNLVSEQDEPRLQGHFEDALEGVSSLCEFETADGRYFRASFVPIRDDAGAVVRLMGLTADVTQRRKAEARAQEYQARLRGLTAELSMAEERERRRIASELHDGISQSLAAARMKVAEAQRTAGASSAGSLQEVMRLLDSAVQHSRSLMLEISPPVLYDLGFEAAAQWLTEEFSRRHGIEIALSVDDAPKPLSESLEVFLFKALRELLINVVSHSGAGKAQVDMAVVDGLLEVTVRDDGRGFDVGEIVNGLSTGDGFDLFNIRDRLDFYGGSSEIESSPGRGTSVVMRVPLEPIEAVSS